MREDFYESSVGPQNLKSQKALYTVYHVLFIISIIAFIVTFYLWFMLGDSGFIFLMVCFVLSSVLFYFIRRRLYLFFDYTYISGEIRIVKVLNAKARRLFLKIDCKSIYQVGKVGSDSFNKLYEANGIKKKIATPNGLNAENQLFYLAATVENENTLIVLECEEKLLSFIVAYRGRNIIEKDYK